MIETHPGDERDKVRFGDLQPGDCFEWPSLLSWQPNHRAVKLDTTGDCRNAMVFGSGSRVAFDDDDLVTPLDATFTPRAT